MAKDFDINKVTAELVESWVENILSSGNKLVKITQNALRISYSAYLKTSIDKYSKIKTILYRDKPVYLYDFYEHIKVKHGTDVLETEDVGSLLSISHRIIVTGTAGIGKSTLFKHLFLSALKKKKMVPIFVELRNLNNNYDGELLNCIHSGMYALGFKLEKDFLIDTLKSGNTLILFDGYDEINSDLKPAITQEIWSLASQFPKTHIIISSRPDEEFVSWHDFSELKTLPLDKKQACGLIGKLKYDATTKRKFLAHLEKGLYSKHKDFLSNPLLLTIMLMTYGQNADIPNKMHIFYSQVFDTLFNKHDATKAIYKRKMHTDLAIDDFKTVLAAFSILSHSKHMVSFSHNDAISLLTNVKRITHIDFNEEYFFKDLLKSVCILNQEGLQYTYTHKTFQEFFSAIYISRTDENTQGALLQKLRWDIDGEKILQMLFEMEPDLIEKKLIMPKIRSISTKFNILGEIIDSDRFEFFKYLYTQIGISEFKQINSLTIRNSEEFHFCETLYKFYPRMMKSVAFFTEEQGKKFSEVALELGFKNYVATDDFKIDSELGQILLSNPTAKNRYLDFMKELMELLEKKHHDKAKSIEEILLQSGK